MILIDLLAGMRQTEGSTNQSCTKGIVNQRLGGPAMAKVAKCPGCKGSIDVDPSQDKVVCPHCGAQMKVAKRSAPAKAAVPATGLDALAAAASEAAYGITPPSLDTPDLSPPSLDTPGLQSAL